MLRQPAVGAMISQQQAQHAQGRPKVGGDKGGGGSALMHHRDTHNREAQIRGLAMKMNEMHAMLEQVVATQKAQQALISACLARRHTLPAGDLGVTWSRDSDSRALPPSPGEFKTPDRSRAWLDGTDLCPGSEPGVSASDVQFQMDPVPPASAPARRELRKSPSARTSETGTSILRKSDLEASREHRNLSRAERDLREREIDQKEIDAVVLAYGFGIMPESVNKIRITFDDNDTEQDRQLSAAELVDMVYKITKMECSERTAQKLMRHYDTDKSGGLDFFEMVMMIGRLTGMSAAENPEEIAEIMKAGVGVEDVDDAELEAERKGGGSEDGGSLKDDIAAFGSALVSKHLGKDQLAAQRANQRMRVQQVAYERELKRSKMSFLFHPYRPFHQIWDMFVAIVLLTTVITIPLSLGFEELAERLLYFNLVVDIIFMADVAKNFFTGYVDSEDRVVMQWGKICKNYVTGWFLPDTISSIPMDFVAPANPGGDSSSGGGATAKLTKTLKLLRLLRMAKLFRLMRMSRVFKYIRRGKSWFEEKTKIHISDGIWKMLNYVIFFFILALWLGALNFMVVRIEDTPGESWVAVWGLTDLDVGDQVMWAFFKALYQMIGGEEMLPSGMSQGECHVPTPWCTIESWITLISLVIGSAVYAFFISTMSSIVLRMDMAGRNYEERIAAVTQYMRVKQLPLALRDRIRDYYAIRFKDNKIFDEERIMADLSNDLRAEVLKHNSKDIFDRVPLFCVDSPEEFAKSISQHIQPLVYFTNMVIFYHGTTASEMYFIFEGVVEIFLPAELKGTEGPNWSEADKEDKIVTTISSGSYFGEVALLMPEEQPKRSASAKALEVCNIYSLSQSNLMQCLADHPHVRRRMLMQAAQRLYRVKHLMGLREFLPPAFIEDHEDKTAREFSEARALGEETTHLKSAINALAGKEEHIHRSVPKKAVRRARASLTLRQTRAIILEHKVNGEDQTPMKFSDLELQSLGELTAKGGTPHMERMGSFKTRRSVGV